MNVKVEGYEGIAFYDPYVCEEHGEDCRIVVMVGDDHAWHVEVDDITELEEDEFCGECGQVGCGWG